MATTNQMIQFFTEQYLASHVQTVYSLDDEAFLLLDPNRKTVIREITTEEMGGVVGSKCPGIVPLGLTDRAYAEVQLVSLQRGKDQFFYAPSHVASPAFSGMGLAILKVFEVGYSVDSPGQLSLSRGIGAHAYIDQID